MDRVFLFSPVGGKDPISSFNKRDGSMLHICRNYDVTDVYLYMSKEMCDNEDKDQRYTKAIDYIGEIKGRKINRKLIRRKNLKEVQEFDQFYSDFVYVIKEIQGQMRPNDILLLNVSSGTPAMKSALLVIQELGDIRSKTIQVSTPEKAQNKGSYDENYDIDKLLVENLDNDENSENRTKEVKCNNILKLRNIGFIKVYIKNFNYESALSIANTMPESSKDFIKLIELANFRLKLDVESMKKILDENIEIEYETFLPYEGNRYNDCIEYLLYLDVTLKKKNYLDFVRGITPIMDKTYEIMINEGNHPFNLNKVANENKGTYRLSEEKLEQLDDSTIKNIICKYSSPSELNNRFIPSRTLEFIVREIYKNDSNTLSTINILSKVHRNIRNIAAHQIKMINDDFIKEKTKQKSNDIMGHIKKLLRKTTNIEDKNLWKSYDEMNDYIIRVIEESLKI